MKYNSNESRVCVEELNQFPLPVNIVAVPVVWDWSQRPLACWIVQSSLGRLGP